MRSAKNGGTGILISQHFYASIKSRKALKFLVIIIDLRRRMENPVQSKIQTSITLIMRLITISVLEEVNQLSI